MRTALMLSLLLAVACPAASVDLGSEKPAKPAVHGAPSVPDPDVLRQGGDTILDAVPIVIGDDLDGTTTGYTDDYDEVCPYGGLTAPDVVYTFTPAASISITVDLYGSSYDTKIYLYDEDLELVACNDDYYSDWTSRLENVPVAAGGQYFLIIDGYGSANGVYTGYTEEFVPCVVECPAFIDDLEGEPPLVDGYVDDHNGGCNTAPAYPFQTIHGLGICATSGYYLNASGGPARDTDWYVFTGWGGWYDFFADAEEAMFLYLLGPHDCGSVEVIENVPIGPCAPGGMSMWVEPGTVLWFWFGPQRFWEGATYEFDYYFVPLYPDPVESHSWTEVKSLFD
ncbi:MAG TPA: hypothetical protein PLL30_14980 [Candidatus Krumholzibacteria bacterium]|nr:hypothetical protein [Candidatus Krumholzibacteria bacterium]HPD73073.1 hypothetical protein [Candidatus Krumholzibacteria bacterium]HRY41873.1 hypothetical protein [Candidatus Krumholzibacteria bacterium]